MFGKDEINAKIYLPGTADDTGHRSEYRICVLWGLEESDILDSRVRTECDGNVLGGDEMYCQCGTELNRISVNDYICPVCGNKYRTGLNGIVERNDKE